MLSASRPFREAGILFLIVLENSHLVCSAVRPSLKSPLGFQHTIAAAGDLLTEFI